MKALVAGGAGFIGSNLVDRLIEEGFSVCIVDNLFSGSLKNVNRNAKLYLADIRDREIISKIFDIEKPTYVFQLAAQIDVRLSVKNPIFDATVNIIGGLNLLEESVIHNAKKIIYTNTGGALYGQVRAEDLPVKEDYPINPDCHYGLSKYTFENYLKLYYKLYGLNFTSLRLPNVYGDKQNPNGEAGVVAIFIYKILKNEQPIIYGDGNQTRDYTYVKDVIEALSLSKDKGNGDCFNIGTSKETSVNELYRIIKKICGTQIDPKYAPKRVGEVDRIALNSEKAKNVLCWKAKTRLEQGLNKTYEYFKNEMAI